MATADQLLFAVTLVAALGCGLMAGLFFAFSVSVMKAPAISVWGGTVSANARIGRLARWFGAVVAKTSAGPAWMQDRGWSQIEWQITRAQWEDVRLTRGS